VSRRSRWPVAAAVAGLLAAVACGNGGGGGSSSSSGSATIEFATQGLGSEGDASKAAVAAFEKANPNIHVNILTLSPDANNAYSQLTQRFAANSSTPDVITSDVIWPATFAKSGWIKSLDSYNINKSNFFPGQIQGATYNGKLYGVPWFINAEGVYYRKDLVATPPSSPQQLVTDAQQAIQKDPTLKMGLAFQGDKYEGGVTAFMNFAAGFGGTLDLKHIASNQNVEALTYMKSLIYQSKISPQAVTSFQEPDVEKAYLSGQTAFAMNWPYVYSEAQLAPGGTPKNPAVYNKTGWVPFPSTSSPKATLGGDDLLINAKSQHADAAYKFIQYLTTDNAQISRAIAAGDPPAVKSAYNNSLFSQAAYYRDEEKVFNVVQPRPVTPLWPQVSSALQTQLNAALANQTDPKAALTAAQQQINQIVGG
jgi:multiple sugar transport system substrate-binding protein